jgi:hypothetical protein
VVFHAPAALSPGNNTMNERECGAQSRSGRFRQEKNLLALRGFETPDRPVRSTDAIPKHRRHAQAQTLYRSTVAIPKHRRYTQAQTLYLSTVAIPKHRRYTEAQTLYRSTVAIPKTLPPNSYSKCSNDYNLLK